MHFPFVSRFFIAISVYLPVRAPLRARTSKLFMFCFLDEHILNKTNGKIRLYIVVLRFTHDTRI